MTNLNEFNKVFADLQTAFPLDQKAFEDGAKAVASFGERFAAVGYETASKSNEITVRATQESIANLRVVSVVRDEPTAYVTAFADFAQTQMELAVRVAEQLGAVAQQAQTRAVELATEAGEAVSQKAAVNVNVAAKPAKAARRKAA
ncbi:hypothetical protein [Tropicimonas sp. IMCC6043]|uniref:hypothetical protein n=1 Tax=Tropicimonas sp. IMCC6043 TaxID=2510645 RepID=UPI00101BDB6F|nr:hypothetical protein [Tropicimonas sp. IMCC6043]RYH10007.1 hypothetical protein EU800_10700 [Tropicimonas sp. IMCC6043]